MRVSVVPYPYQHLVLSVILTLTIPLSALWHLTVGLKSTILLFAFPLFHVLFDPFPLCFCLLLNLLLY